MKIFIAQTPYHVLLSYGLAKSAPDGQNIIVYMPNNLNLTERHVKELIDNPESPFFKQYYLNDGINQQRKFRDLYTIFRNSRFLKTTLKKELPSEIFVFNDGLIYNQYLININNKLGGANYYVEDGGAVYSNNNVTYGPLSNLVSLLFFRMPFYNIKILGSHRDLNQIIVTHPEMVRHDLDISKVSAMPPRVWSEVEKDLIAYPPSVIQNSPDCNIDNILLLPLRQDLDKNSENKLIKLIEKLHSKINGNTLIKYHPREKEKYIPQNLSDKFVQIDQGLPTETLVIFNKRTLRTVISLYFDSTALITTRHLCGDSVEIISTSAIFNTNGFNTNVLDKTRILKPKSVVDLIKNFN